MPNDKVSVKVPPSLSVSGLPLFASEKSAEIDGIGMGVLTNGVPYLTQAGVARLCGVGASSIRALAGDWKNERDKPRGLFINDILKEHKYFDDNLFIKVEVGTNQEINAFPDVVCMAILEYYAFEARTEEAVKRYRFLARKTLRDFIYEKVGYDPAQALNDSWKHYTDRVSILKDSVPVGYFSIFNESNGMIVDMIKAGVIINDKTVPDGSVGIHWGNLWRDQNLADKYGERIEYDHFYPEAFRQSRSNPQKANAYPDAALGEFRRWFREVYLPTKFPKYILSKHKAIPGGKEEAKMIADIYKPKAIS
ncbi:hypothetical protein RYZ26_12860 [Terasakiella sp. A23]|uniref:hypothetical protein n=1 Tax=Terasakiella sp. FCG-A23 TaxID=3080561 RepID=UPI0029557A47|nr:hypothetical protein [Terasakiella sp. A23]MDV7340489.1 hypothetical protein [Terasakiella sp. A23]